MAQNIRISELIKVTDLTLDGVFPLSQPDPTNSDVMTTYSANLQQVLDLFAVIFPTGLILPYGGKDVTPAFFQTSLKGWALCDGSSLVKSNFTALYAAIGDTYGASTNTFKLPDLRGRTLIGAGQGTGLFGNYVLGVADGVENVTLNINQIPSHSHTYDRGKSNAVYQSGTNQSALDPQGPNVSTSSANGGGLGHTNMQPYTVINYIIKT